ncbi:hypothetical protein ERD95_07360 [Enterobacteriaceae bacterium ML5]|nr:hypothetical protein ERD95_07360 [Enterobacteriaceae bacterium ML5]
MAKQYAAIITSKGQALIAAAIKGGTTVNITEIAVGDGNGSIPVPTVGQTALVNETARIKLNSLTVDAVNLNHIIADGVIPADTGGFWLREVGLFTDDGILLAVSALPPTYKPSAEEGATNSQRILITLIVSDASAVNITVDNTTVMASESYVDDKITGHEKSRNHPDGTLKEKGFVQLSSATNSTSEALAATPKAVKAANDNAGSRLKADKNLSDLPSVSDAKKNLELDKVGNYAAVQSGGGLHAAGNVHRINIDWDDVKLWFTVDDTDQGAIFTTSNPPTATDTHALPLAGGDLTGIVNTSAEIRSTHDDNFRMVNGDRGTYWRLDENNLYLMKTASGDQNGSYDDTRPIRVDLVTGIVYINGARPYDPNNKPSTDDIGAIKGDACNQAGFVSQNADDPYMMYGGNTIVQLAARNWVSQTFVTAVRLGSERVQASTNDSGGVVSLGGGELFTGAQGVGGSDFNKAQWRVRQLQYLVNGQWVAAGSI